MFSLLIRTTPFHARFREMLFAFAHCAWQLAIGSYGPCSCHAIRRSNCIAHWTCTAVLIQGIGFEPICTPNRPFENWKDSTERDEEKNASVCDKRNTAQEEQRLGTNQKFVRRGLVSSLLNFPLVCFVFPPFSFLGRSGNQSRAWKWVQKNWMKSFLRRFFLYIEVKAHAEPQTAQGGRRFAPRLPVRFWLQ